jgi:AcrR family transcriptional regulator
VGGTGAGRPQRGRRPGRSGTREAILAAARRSFARRGYDATTIRAVAADAGVDPALVGHYFGPKDALFAAALELPRVPSEALSDALEAPDAELGARIASTFLAVWDDATGGALVALLRSAGSNERAAATIREFASSEVVPRVAGRLRGPDARLRASLIASHLVGLAMVRHVLRVEPVASAPAAELGAAVGRALQSYIEFNEP